MVLFQADDADWLISSKGICLGSKPVTTPEFLPSVLLGETLKGVGFKKDSVPSYELGKRSGLKILVVHD